MTPASNFAYQYVDLLGRVLNGGLEERNGRTGRTVRVHRGGVSLSVDLSDGRLPVCGVRRLFPRTAAAELAWFLMGTKDISWLRRYAPIWDKFVEADGTTIEAAYGYRWRHQFGRDQLTLALAALQRDPSDRRVYVSNWDPGLDGLGAPNQRNVPCPVGFTLSLVDGEAHMSLFIRSSDIFVGLPYDVMGHALLLSAVSTTLGVRPGVLHVSLAHAHLYDSHFDMAAEAIQQKPVALGPLMPSWGIDDIMIDPPGYVNCMALLSAGAPWPTYCPRPEVVA